MVSFNTNLPILHYHYIGTDVRLKNFHDRVEVSVVKVCMNDGIFRILRPNQFHDEGQNCIVLQWVPLQGRSRQPVRRYIFVGLTDSFVAQATRVIIWAFPAVKIRSSWLFLSTDSNLIEDTFRKRPTILVFVWGFGRKGFGLMPNYTIYQSNCEIRESTCDLIYFVPAISVLSLIHPEFCFPTVCQFECLWLVAHQMCAISLLLLLLIYRHSHRTGCTCPDPTNFWDSNIGPPKIV